MSIDSIGDFLTIIRNGIRATKRSVTAPFSNEKLGIAQVLKEEGFIKDFQKIEDENKKSLLKVYLKYVDGESVIHEIVRISKPGKRTYEGVSKMRSVIGGLGVAILTTNLGIVADKKAKELSVGGEVICHVW
ncbi:TPA: 30S ribosomal protein S8 [Candidatus Dependentiae bacterium]|nr:MAG: 30S ribosomal protein S8 [candidate division TM6 bacterium GW2011_GWE2_31_21]KKP53113.1 MAG: 30S ribosomal protein S8 [candidate division TM6 bacterium GW2011_GWF2_33_332]HBS47932.1 30S ribosomal protein S8 [Candidatus Dependentiae bacterium]HBZ73464.1 30S ribosomal protein S8 [Candidatus Dependentiae bacterium]